MFLEVIGKIFAQIAILLSFITPTLTLVPIAEPPHDHNVVITADSTSTVSVATPKVGASSSTVSVPLSDSSLPKGSAWLDVLTLGDNKFVTAAPKKGYIYLCHVGQGDRGGAGSAGPWINAAASTWRPKEKMHVAGEVMWPNAATSIKISGTTRVIRTNGLPINHTSGIFPIGASDPASEFDRNPNSIKAQSFTFNLPTSPKITSAPGCIYGEVGVMTSGVLLFDGFDAGNRDAAAWEVQDRCGAHPQVSGVYHYHSLSSCIKNINVDSVIGYAFDGFPITGAKLASGNYLKTADLDLCHGLTSEVMLDGKYVTTYHYVMTQDFPYSVSCFKGASTVTGPLGGRPSSPTQPVSQQTTGTPSAAAVQTAVPTMSPSSPGAPPPEAIAACKGKEARADCSFVSPRGDMVTGMCDTPPSQSAAQSTEPSLACIPQ